MRTYPIDSPQAAGRIIAMAALADGHLCHSELDRIENSGFTSKIGLTEEEWASLVRDYCEDLLGSATSGLSPLALDERVVAGLLDEVRDPELRRAVLAACEAVVDGDSHRAENESAVLNLASSRWRGAAQAA